DPKHINPGNDLILHNLTTGQDITIAEVTEFAWQKSGAWLIYAVASADQTKNGAFARNMADGSVRTLKQGNGHYKSFAFDDDSKQLAFLSDQADYDKPVSPYRVYYWKPTDASATELVSATTKGVPANMVVADSAPRFTDDNLSLLVATAPPPNAP